MVRAPSAADLLYHFYDLTITFGRLGLKTLVATTRGKGVGAEGTPTIIRKHFFVREASFFIVLQGPFAFGHAETLKSAAFWHAETMNSPAFGHVKP